MGSRRWVTAGTVGAVAALTILAAGPASATAAGNVAAGTPSWSSSILKASGSFTNKVTTGSAMYSYTLQLVRTNSATKPTCNTGCATITTSAGVVTQTQLNSVTSSLSVAKSTTITVPSLSFKCPIPSPTLTTNRYYWSWLKVADASGNVVTSISSYIAGKYC